MTRQIVRNLEAKIRNGRVSLADLGRIDSIIREVRKDFQMDKLQAQPIDAPLTPEEIQTVSDLRSRRYSMDVIATLTGIPRARLRRIGWAIYQQRSLRVLS